MPEFTDLLTRAKSAFEKKLWNGRYYNFDCSATDHAKSIMTDQLCGLWYLLLSSLPNQVSTSYTRSLAITLCKVLKVPEFGSSCVI